MASAIAVTVLFGYIVINNSMTVGEDNMTLLAIKAGGK